MIPKFIIIHTAAYQGDADIETIREWHLQIGFRDVGYHYYIRRDGQIQIGRDDRMPGAHCVDMGMNAKSLGICFEGHGDFDPFTQEQRDSLCGLYEKIYKRWVIRIMDVLGHRETGAPKTCPGNKVDMDDLRTMLRLNSKFLPEKKGDEIERGTVEPAGLPPRKPEQPPEWTIPVSEGNTLAEFKSTLERKYKRQRIMILLYNGLVSIAARWVPELNHLKMRTPMSSLMDRLQLRLKSTKEGFAWVFALLVMLGGYFGFSWDAVQLMAVYEIVGGAVVCALAAYYAVRDLFVRED